MTSSISVTDAKVQLLALISAAERGETVIITRFGDPVALIGPVPAERAEA